MNDALNAALQPALDRYTAAQRAHARDYDVWPEARCQCGWEPGPSVRPRNRANSLGMHISHAHRAASKAYDAEAAQIIHDLNRSPR